MSFKQQRESLNSNLKLKLSAAFLSLCAISCSAYLYLEFGKSKDNLAAVAFIEGARVYHVAKWGSDENLGTASAPFLTISKGAEVAMPGDTVLVHEGIYRERVSPARSGTEGERITYAAAPGEKVDIRGSEVIKGWTKVSGNMWKVSLPPSLFGSFNPYTTLLNDLKLSDGSSRSSGDVFLNGLPLEEVGSSATVSSKSKSWYTSDDGLTLYANFGGTDPNAAIVEISVREVVFAPTAWNLSYITVRGFNISHSANSYESLGSNSIRRGMLSTNGGYGWIIEENDLSYAHTVALDFGLVGTDVGPIPESFGHHLIRNNLIRYAGTTGISALQGAFTEISGNAIVKNDRFKTGAYGGGGGRMLRDSVGMLIKNNYFYSNYYQAFGIDFGIQGARITGNTFVENPNFSLEASHGPTSIDNNVFIKTKILEYDVSCSMFSNNLFYNAGTPTLSKITTRGIPYFEDHSSTRLGTSTADKRNIEFYLNMFIGSSGITLPASNNNFSNWNVFYNGATKSVQDKDSITSSKASNFAYNANENGASISFDVDDSPFNLQLASATSTAGTICPVVTEERPQIDTDFFGAPIVDKSLAGPFSNIKSGHNDITLFVAPKVNASASLRAYSISSSSLKFWAVRDGSPPPSQTIIVKNIGEQSINVNITKNAAWLDLNQTYIENLAPGAAFPIVISATDTSSVGTYNDSLIFTNSENYGEKSLNVSYSVIDPSDLPPPECPVGKVSLSRTSIMTGETSVISAPSGFTDGSFISSNSAVAEISSSTLTGLSAGSSSISGVGFTAANGALGCSLSPTSITVKAAAKKYSYTVSPSSLSFSAKKGGPLPAVQSFVVKNTGNQDLTIKVTEGTAWLNELTPSITIAPGQSLEAPFEITRTSDTVGTHKATVTFTEAHTSKISRTINLIISKP